MGFTTITENLIERIRLYIIHGSGLRSISMFHGFIRTNCRLKSILSVNNIVDCKCLIKTKIPSWMNATIDCNLLQSITIFRFKNRWQIDGKTIEVLGIETECVITSTAPQNICNKYAEPM